MQHIPGSLGGVTDSSRAGLALSTGKQWHSGTERLRCGEQRATTVTADREREALGMRAQVTCRVEIPSSMSK